MRRRMSRRFGRRTLRSAISALRGRFRRIRRSRARRPGRGGFRL